MRTEREVKGRARDETTLTGNWFPLSHGQEALWFLWRLAPQCWAYNMVFPFGVHGELDLAAFQRSLQKLSDRHPCMRTEFREQDGKVLQRAIDPYQIQLGQIDATDWNSEQVDAAVRDTARLPFDLEVSAVPRLTLMHHRDDYHVFLIVIHHIVSDLLSLIVLMDEFRQIYPAEKAGIEWSLPELPASYEDYVCWQRELVEGEAGARLWSYWQTELGGELPVLDLPIDRPRPPLRSFRGGIVHRRMDAAIGQGLRQLGRSANASFFTVLMAAYVVFLHRYTGQTEILVGTPTGGRNSPQHADFVELFGDLVNMAPIRVDLRAHPTFRQLLSQTRTKVRELIEHQDFPFSLIVDRLQPVRDLSRSPIFQTTFVLQKFHRFKELSRLVLAGLDEQPIPFADLLFQPLFLDQQDGQFDLNLEMKENDSGSLVAAWKYSTDLFEADTITRMAENFETLLRQFIVEPDRAIGELRLLTPDESIRVVTKGQGAQVELPTATSVCELFEAQIQRRGDSIAVRCGEATLTYSELGSNVQGFARSLRKLGVGPDVLVALLLPRGLEFVAMLLAINKAGGAFLPLDPRHPLSRTAQVLESSGASLVLVSREIKPDVLAAMAAVAKTQGPGIVAVEDLATQPIGESLQPVHADSLAYVMYTSGSTGNPKGVMVAHRGMVNHVLGKIFDLGMGENDILAQNGPQSFDIVVWQCLAPLVLGGQVLVIPNEGAEDPAALTVEIERRGVTVLQLVPLMLQAVLDDLKDREEKPALTALRWIVPTGEALPTELCRRWLDLYPSIPILNTYGSTECSDDQCHYEIGCLTDMDEAVAVASIGKPIQNMTAYVLDRNLAVVPPGVVGELYLGGIGVGLGYRHDAARTSAAFVPDPFSQSPGARMYRTRDWARRRADGNLDFLGRVDQMIKLRGFRIEPKEIETALCLHPAISEAAVVTQDLPSGERRLVGYVVPSSKTNDCSASVEEFRQFLVDKLPQYMIPSTVCFLEALPLSANGKLDRCRLPAVDWTKDQARKFVAPRTPTEETLAELWAEALDLERVGVTDDFFAIGGDSIVSIQILARCKRTGLRLSPSDVFLHPTIAALAALADRNSLSLSAVSEGRVAAHAQLHVSPEHLELALGEVDFD